MWPNAFSQPRLDQGIQDFHFLPGSAKCYIRIFPADLSPAGKKNQNLLVPYGAEKHRPLSWSVLHFLLYNPPPSLSVLIIPLKKKDCSWLQNLQLR